MQRISLFIILFSLSIVCKVSGQNQTIPATTNEIVIGQKLNLHSAILNEDREIWIHVPYSASKPENKDRKYPVAYLLDGDWHFYSVMGIIRQLSLVNLNKIAPEMIIVAITHIDRYKDLTPSHVGDEKNTSGGGQNFIQFMNRELIPFIDSEYPTSNQRTLIGHSLGGLIVINTLIHHRDMFDNYLSIDPSLWWDDQKVLSESLRALKLSQYKGKRLFVGIANTMPEGMDITTVINDDSAKTQHIRSILTFTKSAEVYKQNGLRFDWKYYPNEGHGSVPVPAEYDAFHFFFK